MLWRTVGHSEANDWPVACAAFALHEHDGHVEAEPIAVPCCFARQCGRILRFRHAQRGLQCSVQDAKESNVDATPNNKV